MYRVIFLKSPLYPDLCLTGQANLGPWASCDARTGASDESTQQLELSHFQSSGEDSRQDRLYPQSGKDESVRKCWHVFYENVSIFKQIHMFTCIYLATCVCASEHTALIAAVANVQISYKCFQLCIKNQGIWNVLLVICFRFLISFLRTRVCSRHSGYLYKSSWTTSTLWKMDTETSRVSRRSTDSSEKSQHYLELPQGGCVVWEISDGCTWGTLQTNW